MKILHVLPSVDPKGGGPMEGVRQRGLRLLQMGHQIEVLSLDEPNQPFLASYGLPVHALGPSQGKYRYNSRLVPWLQANAGEYDAVVINGIWQYHSFGVWLASRRINLPYFVFTHGMLDPWFKYAYPLKHFKKRLYWPWTDFRVLRDARAVLFTSEDEKLLARQTFSLYKAREEVVSYGTALPPQDAEVLRENFFSVYPSLRGKRILVFLGRIHEKKGCDLLIQAFARIAALDTALHLLMAGPDQTGWGAELQAQADQLGIMDRISWPGMLQGDLKWGAFYAGEAFVLPSHQENFGIAVAEALACGLPVLISDKVNIWREIKADGAGIVSEDTLEGTENSLRLWLGLDAESRLKMVESAKLCYHQRYTIDVMAQSFIDAITVNLARPEPAPHTNAM